MKPAVQLRLPVEVSRQLSLLAGAYDVSRAVMAEVLIDIAYRQTFREARAYERADRLRSTGKLLADLPQPTTPETPP